MKEIAKLLKEYAKRHPEINQGGGLTIKFHDDCSGCFYPFMGTKKECAITFKNEAEFLEKIKE